MTPETKFQQIVRALIAMAFAIVMLPIFGLLAAASGIEKLKNKKG
jgi:hypothetical protein